MRKFIYESYINCGYYGQNTNCIKEMLDFSGIKCYNLIVVWSDVKKLVLMTLRVHPFPYRTRKLSSMVPKILDWWRSGKIGRCQHLKQPPNRVVVFLQFYLIIGIVCGKILSWNKKTDQEERTCQRITENLLKREEHLR